MRAEGVADAAIETFRDLYGRWQAGETGMLPEAEIEPLHDVPSLEDLEDAESRGARSRPWCSSSTAASARAWA